MGFIVDADDQYRRVLPPTVQFADTQPPGRPWNGRRRAEQNGGDGKGDGVTVMESRTCDGILAATCSTLHQRDSYGNLGLSHK